MKKSGIKALWLGAILGFSGFCGFALAEEAASATKKSVPSIEEVSPSAGTDVKVNINSASAEQLAQQLVGIGLKRAEAIVSFREEHGPFTQIEQLQDVPGIGAALLERNMSRLSL